MPVVVATHAAADAPAPLRTVHVGDAGEARLLTFGAAVTLLARRAAGGFPIKLLNYMEASRAIVARASVAESLVHQRSAWILADDAPPAAWAAAVNALLADPAGAARLGAEARRTLEREHDPAALARDVLALLASLARLCGGGAREIVVTLAGPRRERAPSAPHERRDALARGARTRAIPSERDDWRRARAGLRRVLHRPADLRLGRGDPDHARRRRSRSRCCRSRSSRRSRRRPSRFRRTTTAPAPTWWSAPSRCRSRSRSTAPTACSTCRRSSANDGQASLTVTFELGRDPDIATVNVNNRVAVAEPRLPEEVRRFGITVRKQSPDLTLVVNLLLARRVARRALPLELRAASTCSIR